MKEDVAWIEDPLNKDGTVNQGAIYRKFAKMLEGYKSRIVGFDDLSEMLIGFKVSSREEFDPYVDNAMKFIVLENDFVSIMQALEGVSCVSGTFDYNNRVFDFEISDLALCADELMISQEMLGYVFGDLAEFAPEISFDGNSCHFVYNR